MKKNYLFDLDGTLVNSMGTWGGTMLKILDEEQVDYPSDTVRIITPLGYKGTALHFINNLGVKKEEGKLIERMYELAEYEYANTIELKSGVKEYLLRLTDEGMSINVLTASPHRLTDACLKRNGVYDLFDNVWSIEDYGMTKDNTEIYREAAKRMGCKTEDIIFFDDNLIALKTAKEAGATIIGVHDSFSDGDTDTIKGIVDKYIGTFNELL